MPALPASPRACQAPGCAAAASAAEFMCAHHWAKVPSPMRAVLSGGADAAGLEAIARAAIAAVAHRDSRDTPRPAVRRKPTKPVQLALFDLPG